MPDRDKCREMLTAPFRVEMEEWIDRRSLVRRKMTA